MTLWDQNRHPPIPRTSSISTKPFDSLREIKVSVTISYRSCLRRGFWSNLLLQFMENFYVNHFNFTLPIKSGTSFSILPFEMDGYQRLFNLFRQYQSLSFKRRRDTTMLTVWVRRTPHHAFCQGVLLGCFASFPFAFCSCLFIFCFRPLSLSFLPLSPIAYLFFPLSLIFSPRGRRCVVSSVFAYFHCPGGQ